IVWARDSVRGIASRLIAVTPRSASALAVRGSMRGLSKPSSACPDRSFATSASDGLATRRMASDCAYSSSPDTTEAPAAWYASSRMAAPEPAPRSTRMSSPAALSLPSTSGTRATRRSPGAVSLATPTFMGTTLTWGFVTSRGGTHPPGHLGHAKDTACLRPVAAASCGQELRSRSRLHRDDHDVALFVADDLGVVRDRAVPPDVIPGTD